MHEGSIILLPVWVRPLGTSAIWVSITNGVLVDKFAIRSFFRLTTSNPGNGSILVFSERFVKLVAPDICFVPGHSLQERKKR